MNTQIFNNSNDLGLHIANEIIENLITNPKQMLCIAAGNTSLSVFKHLILAYKQGRIHFSDSYFVAMDEWLHMNENTAGSCGNFLVEHFLKEVDYQKEHVKLWDGCSKTPELECLDVENFIKDNSTSGVIDYLVLGMGMNGHLALNEPGVDFSLTSHICTLDTVTQIVGQKYFSTSVPLTGGVTLGIRTFQAAKRTVLMVDGAHKSEMVAQVLHTQKPTNQIPATALHDFENASFYCDSLAGSLL